jgi:hypothetical protein
MIETYDERDELALSAGGNNNVAPAIEYSWDED